MSEAEDTLNSLTTNDIALYTADSSTEENIVIDRNRTITVPDSLKRIAVQFDNEVETVTFDCPRYWDGKDISAMTIYINYLRADNKPGSYIADNVTIDSTDTSIIHFNWSITRNASEIKGKLQFLVCAKASDSDGNETNRWNSEVNKDMYISEGLECTDSIVESYPDVIEYLLSASGCSNNDKEELDTRIDELISERG